jgi:hypothetical protein
LFIIILTAISLILTANSVCALDVTFTAPSETEVNSSFDIIISTDVSENYDVKAFVENDAEKIISKTMNDGKWKSSNYYLIGVFPEQNTFSLIVISEEEGNVCVRLRKTGTTSTPEKFCQGIKIQESQDSVKTDTETDTEKETNSEANDVVINNQAVADTTNVIPAYSNINNDDNEIIYLNSPAKTPETALTNYAKTRLIVCYAFAALAIILLVLIALDKI